MLVAGLGALVAFSPVADYDIWWHVANGELLLKSWQFQPPDPFSHTAAAQPDLLYSWFFDLFAALVVRCFGVGGLPFVQAGIAAGCFLLLYLAGGFLGLDPRVRLIGLVLGMPILRFHLILRPHLVGYLCLCSLVFLLCRYEARRERSSLVGLVGLIWIWRQIHASWPLGLGILGLYALLPRWMRDEGIPRRGRLIGAVACGSLAFILPPLGWAGTVWIGETLQMLREGGGLVSEWLPPSAFASGFELFWIYALLSTLGLLFHRPSRVTFLVLLHALLCWMALQSIRQICTFYLVSILPVTVAWSGLLGRWTKNWEETVQRAVLSVGVLLASLFCLGASLLDAYPPVGGGIAENAFPSGAARFIERNELRGTMYNTHRLGGYLIWRLGDGGGPKGDGRRVFWDGRLLLYRELFQQIHRAIEDPQPRLAFERLLTRLKVDFAVLDYRDRHPIALHLLQHPGWALVDWDDSAMVLVRRDSELRRLLPQEWRVVRPWERSLGFLDPSSPTLPLARAELARKLAEDPGCAKAMAMYGQLLIGSGNPEAAAGMLSKFLRKERESEWVRLILAQAFLAAGKRSEAEKALEPLRWSRRSRAAIQQLLAPMSPVAAEAP